MKVAGRSLFIQFIHVNGIWYSHWTLVDASDNIRLTGLDWLVNYLITLLIDWLIDWLLYWLIDWLIDCAESAIFQPHNGGVNYLTFNLNISLLWDITIAAGEGLQNLGQWVLGYAPLPPVFAVLLEESCFTPSKGYRWSMLTRIPTGMFGGILLPL